MDKLDLFVTNWSDYPALPDDADALIFAKVNRERDSLRKGNFGEVECSERITNYRGGKQMFAVMGAYAYELLNMIIRDDDKHFAYRPALLNGAAYRAQRDEGASGTLHWIWSGKLNKWMLTWFSASGWVRTEELDQSPGQILGNIAEEIDAGQTPLTGNNSKPEYQ